MSTSAAAIRGDATGNFLSSPYRGKWSHLVPVIATLSLGSLFIPNSAREVFNATLIGTSALMLTAVIHKSTNPQESRYLFVLTGFAAARELIFRGTFQPLLTRAIVWIVPTATATFLGTPLSIATGVSIVAIAAIVGFINFSNEYKNASLPDVLYLSLSTTITDIALGVLAARFGLEASLAAGSIFTTILIKSGA
jgi:hypothetical protein